MATLVEYFSCVYLDVVNVNIFQLLIISSGLYRNYCIMHKEEEKAGFLSSNILFTIEVKVILKFLIQSFNIPGDNKLLLSLL